MAMTHRERMETAWAHREPDRVPIELGITEAVRRHPKSQRLYELADEYATNFGWAPGMGFGFLGLPTEYHEEVIEEVPGSYTRSRRVHKTPVGEFTAVIRQPADNPDYHWEKRFIDTLDDMVRLADAPREPCPWDKAAYLAALGSTGERAVALSGMFHPLGSLVRSACMENVYGWFAGEPEIVHRYLEAANRQVVETVQAMGREGMKPNFCTSAHEMMIPPWMGMRQFDEFVYPYDKAVGQAVHAIGGRWRAHCHGRCMAYLEKFSEMGIDALEPLEAPRAAGDCDLAEAKRRVGDRMLLSGNIASQQFYRTTPEQVRQEVKDAVRAAARGGGFSLKTTGGMCVGAIAMTKEQEDAEVACSEAYMLAGLEYGQYPIKL